MRRINPMTWIILIFLFFIGTVCSVWRVSPDYQWRVTVEYLSGSVLTDTIILPENVTYRQEGTQTRFESLGKNFFGFDAMIPKTYGSIINTIRVVRMEKIGPAPEPLSEFDEMGIYRKRH